MADIRSRKRRSTQPHAKPQAVDAVQPPVRAAHPPQRNLPLLIISAALMLAWIAFLLVVAVSV